MIPSRGYLPATAARLPGARARLRVPKGWPKATLAAGGRADVGLCLPAWWEHRDLPHHHTTRSAGVSLLILEAGSGSGRARGFPISGFGPEARRVRAEPEVVQSMCETARKHTSLGNFTNFLSAPGQRQFGPLKTKLHAVARHHRTSMWWESAQERIWLDRTCTPVEPGWPLFCLGKERRCRLYWTRLMLGYEPHVS